MLGRLERWDDMSSADLHMYEVRVHSFWAQLQDFSQRVNTAGRNIDRAVRLYRFLDQVPLLSAVNQPAADATSLMSSFDNLLLMFPQQQIDRLESVQPAEPQLITNSFYKEKKISASVGFFSDISLQLLEISLKFW